MAFPTSPVDGQTYANALGTIYIYDSIDNKWNIQSQNIGVTGIQGVTGLRGYTGFQGVTGPAGAPQGETGIQGPTGPAGAPQGETGAQGITGLRGYTGFQGTTGLRGITGLKGFTGLRGITGAQGFTGLRGITGAQGFTGLRGITGAQGATGLRGVTGIGSYTYPWKYSFNATLTSEKTNVTGDGTTYKIPFDYQITWSEPDVYNTKTGEYTAPVDGVYHFSTMVTWDGYDGTGIVIGLYIDGRLYENNILAYAGYQLSAPLSVTTWMNAKNKAYVIIRAWGGTKSLDVKSNASTTQRSFFGGYCVYSSSF